MKKKQRRHVETTAATEPPTERGQESDAPASVTPGSLAALVGLGAGSALWALFLWAELLVLQAGGSPFCAIGEQVDCSAVWNSTFATGVHSTTGLPVAAWGLVWGLVALTLPLVALMRRAEGRLPLELLTSVRLTAGTGAVTVALMLAVSLSEGALCVGCFGTYLLVAGYAGVALSGWRSVGFPDLPRAVGWTVALTLVAYFLLLYPGVHTPRSTQSAGRAAVDAASASATQGTGDPDRDVQLRTLVDSLQPALKQRLSNALYFYGQHSAQPVSTPRLLLGSTEAPVRITEFTDVLCSHCATLHETLGRLRERLPEGSFSIEPRQFPLDRSCNPTVSQSGNPVRCVAALAQICMEKHGEDAYRFAKALFDRQKGLTSRQVYEQAAPYMNETELTACMADPSVRGTLESDIADARGFDISGTPLVLVNGRKAVSYEEMLYTMVLTRGEPDHPAFRDLPLPNPDAHLH